jgi:hypothetical protein
VIRISMILAVLATFTALPAMAKDCSKIAAATVNEMRAGAAGWNAADEEIARRAAAAGCIKAQAESGPAGQASASEDNAGAKPQKTFLGFPMNELSGSPSQKPFRRKR